MPLSHPQDQVIVGILLFVSVGCICSLVHSRSDPDNSRSAHGSRQCHSRQPYLAANVKNRQFWSRGEARFIHKSDRNNDICHCVM